MKKPFTFILAGLSLTSFAFAQTPAQPQLPPKPFFANQHVRCYFSDDNCFTPGARQQLKKIKGFDIEAHIATIKAGHMSWHEAYPKDECTWVQNSPYLTQAEADLVFKRVRARLAEEGLCVKWLDDLIAEDDLVFIRSDLTDCDASARYHPVANQVEVAMNFEPTAMSNKDVGDMAHELFHGWYDQVVSLTELNLSLAEEEAFAGALDEFLGMSWTWNGIMDRAIGQAKKYGGTPEDGVNGLLKVHNYFSARPGYHGIFVRGFTNKNTRKYYDTYLYRDHPQLAPRWDYFAKKIHEAGQAARR